LFSLVALRAVDLHAQDRLPYRRAAWYLKDERTFGDAAAARCSVRGGAARFPTPRHDCERLEVPCAVPDRLTELACHAARGPKSS
jgi:hypothetical protein